MAITYTPVTDPNATPQYGQKGPNVVAAQAKYNADNLEGIKAGTITPLATDGMYGPKTQAALMGDNQLIVTSDNARYQGNKALSDFNQYKGLGATQTVTGDGKDMNGGKAYKDDYTSALDALSARSGDSAKSMIATIQAKHQNEVNQLEQNYDSYTRNLEALGIQAGNTTPELVRGQILQLKNQKLDKINKLDKEEQLAMLDAENAQMENDIRTLKEKMDYVRQIRQDKVQAIKDLASQDEDMMQKAEFFGDTIFDSIKGLSSAQKKATLDQLSTQLGIPSMYLTAAAATKAQARSKASGAGTLPKKPEFNGKKLSFSPRDYSDGGTTWEEEFAEIGLTGEKLQAIVRLVNSEGYSLKQLAQSDAITGDQFTYLDDYYGEDEGGDPWE